MHTLIPIFTTTINQEAINSLSAKKLHEILLTGVLTMPWVG